MKTPPITPHLKSIHRTIYLLITVTLGLLLGVFSPAIAANYLFTTINVPGASLTLANGINNAGQIVGRFSDAMGTHGFLLSGGVFTPIDVPGATFTDARGINNSGQIVGEFVDTTGDHGFLLSGGSFTTINVPGATSTLAKGINDSGQIVGIFPDATFNIHGFLLSGGVFTPIDVPGAIDTLAFGINNSGQIVGEFIDATRGHGFLLSGGVFTPIDVPGATVTVTEAHGINDSGAQIVGRFVDGNTHGFLLSGGSFTTINVPGATETQALAINDSGQIVGAFRDSTGFHGFLATPDCTNQVTVNAFTALTTNGLNATISGDSLNLFTKIGTTEGIAFQANVSIAVGLAPIPGIHIKYIQNLTGRIGSEVYQPKPDRLASLMSGATLPLLDRLALPPPAFYDGNFNETNPGGPDRIVTAEDSPFLIDILITRTGPDRQLQNVGVTNAFTMYLGCTVGGDQTFQTLSTWRTLSTMDWVVQYTGTLNPGPPPTFTQGADAGITAQPSVPDGGTPEQRPPIVNDVLTFVDGPP